MKNRNIRQLLLILAIGLLSGCSDGGKDSWQASGSDDATQGDSVAFTISLVSLDIKRISNGESVNVNTDGISSGALTLLR